MDDPRIGSLLVAFVVLIVAAGVGMWLRRQAQRFDVTVDHVFLIGLGLIAAQYANAILGAWGDQILWNLVAPAVGLPQIDLLTAFAGGILIQSLFWNLLPKQVQMVDLKGKVVTNG